MTGWVAAARTPGAHDAVAAHVDAASLAAAIADVSSLSHPNYIGYGQLAAALHRAITA